MNLMKVRGNGCILYFPKNVPNSDTPRGKLGYVVDMDAPLEAEWCKEQEYKLEPAPEATEPSPIYNGHAKRMQETERLRLANGGAPKPDSTPANEPALVTANAPASNTESLRVDRSQPNKVAPKSGGKNGEAA